MRDQKKAEEIAAQRMQLLSPLLTEGLDAGSWDNSQIPLLEFGELSGVNERHDPTEGVVWTNKYIEEVFGK